MRRMKDSGIAWLGDVPEEWGRRKLGSLFTERKTRVSDKDYPPLSVTKKGIVPQLETAAKTDAGDNRKLVCAGDFVINSRSDRKGSCGVSALDGSVSLINIVLTPKPELNSRYAHYLLRSHPFSEEYYRKGKDIVGDLWTTRYKEMKSILLPLPPREEQDAIARYLDGKTANIDRLLDARRKEVSALKELKQAVVARAVAHGLKPDAPMKDSGIAWLGEVPAEWECTKLKYLVVKSNGGAWGDDPLDNKSGDICLRVADFDYQRGRFRRYDKRELTHRIYDKAHFARLALQKGDIIIEKSGGGAKTPVGCAVLYDGEYGPVAYSNFTQRLRFDASKVTPSFIAYWLMAWYAHRLSPFYIKQTTGIQNLDIPMMLAKERIFLPPSA